MNNARKKDLTVTLKLPAGHKEAKRMVVEAFEIRYLLSLCRRHRNNLSAMSREAHLSRRHLRELLRRYELYTGNDTNHEETIPCTADNS